jgi:hypothetical protein
MGVISREYIQETGDWLRGLLDWNLYSTFTFPTDRTPASANKTVGWFIRRYDPEAKYVLVAQVHRFRSCAHVHALVKGLTKYRCVHLMKLWEQRYGGFARIYPYDPNRGAGYYLVRHLQCDSTELDFGNM